MRNRGNSRASCSKMWFACSAIKLSLSYPSQFENAISASGVKEAVLFLFQFSSQATTVETASNFMKRAI